MLDGDFEAAWKISDGDLARRAGHPCHDWPRHLQYIWDGSPLAGKRVLVRCYHGLGDTTQFCRYVPLLCDIAREVVVWAQACLLPLVRTVDERAEFIPLHDGIPQTHYDVDVELMELPHFFRSTAATLPREVPYLRVPARPNPEAGSAPTDSAQERASAFGAGRPVRAGLVWASGDWNRARSIPLGKLEAVLRDERFVWHALQQGEALSHWRSEYGPIAARPDPADLARPFQSLDLIVSVDSFPAHLAGALGLPTWLLLSTPCDWRWQRRGTTTPWYPTMRLFRQAAPGDWSSVVAQLTAEANRLIAPNVVRGSVADAVIGP